jgi:tetratricopeptide (TPR) repeat protein
LKLYRSRAIGFLLVTVLSFAVVFVARSIWSGGAFLGPRLGKIPEPKLDSLQATPRAEVEATRKAAAGAISRSGASPQDRAAAYGRLGATYLAYQLAEPAAACFRNAAALDPASFRWPYLLAHALKASGHGSEAVAAMTSALDLMPRDPQVSPQDRVAARCFLAESAIRADRLDEARRHFEAAVEHSPRAPYPLIRLGQLLVRAGERARAGSFFDRAVASMPARRDLRAWADAQLQAAPGAMATPPFPYADPAIASVRDLDRSSAGLLRLGAASVAQGKRSQALNYFRQAVDADPSSLTARARHAEALLATGNHDEACRELEEVLRREPANRRTRAVLAAAYAISPATRDKALALAAEFRRDPPKEQPFQSLASVYISAGRFADALAVARDAAAIYPKDSWPPLCEAVMLAALGRHAAARAAFEKAAQTFPGNPRVRLLLARYLVTAPDPGARDVRRGLEISRGLQKDGDTVSRAETIAVALAANGRFPAAIQAIKTAISRSGEDTDPDTRNRLQRVLRSLESHKPWTEPWPFHSTSLIE